MSGPSEGLSRIEPVNVTVEDLLLLIGDKETGAKSEAMDMILSIGFDAVYPTLENAVRDDHNANIRNGAMETLVSFGKKSIPNLIKLLEDENEEVRNFSAVMLGDIGNREAVSALIQSLRDNDINVRHGAAEALGKIGDSTALAPLAELLKEDFWLQYPAIVALGEMRDKRAVPHLLELLDNELLVMPVIEALGKIGDKRTLRTLCAFLDHSDDYSLSGALVKAIVSICKELEAVHRHEKHDGFDSNSRLPSVMHEKGGLKLKKLVRQSDNKETVSSAITLLGWLKETTTLPDLINLLETDDYLETIEEAISAMGKEAVPYLIEALSLPFENVRVVAARLIGQLGDDKSVAKLIPLLHGTGELVQEECLEALRGIVNGAMLPELLEMVEFGTEEISVRASETLGYFPFSAFQHLLQKLLSSPDPLKRTRAAILIGFGNKDVSPVMLYRLARDENSSVRKQVIKELGHKRSQESLQILISSLNEEIDDDVKIEAVKSLAEHGKHAPLTDILSLLNTSSENLACAIIEALGKIGSDCAAKALLEYLRGRTVSQHMEFLIIETLGKINYKPALELLSTYLKHHDPDFRQLAVLALGTIASPISLNDIRSACRDSHWSVRVAALHALWKIDSEIALPLTIAALNDCDYMVRHNAVTALEEATPAQAVPLLVDQLSDEENGGFASRGLLKLGQKSLTLLHSLMKKKEYPIEVRERIIDIVGKIGARRSVKHLMEVLDDPIHSIRLAAIDALVFCFDGQLLKELSRIKRSDECAEVRERAKLALKTLTTEKFL